RSDYVTRKTIGTGWDRDNRNAINDNFKKLFDEYTKSGLDASEAKERAIQAVADSVLAKDIAETTRQEMINIIREQTAGGDIVPEVVQARGNQSTLGDRLNSINQDLAQRTTYDYVDLMLTYLAGGAPREIFYSIDALNTKYPN